MQRISVRTLVEFSLHGEDLYPSGGSIRDMQEGMFGHKGRQGSLGEGWEAEVPLSLEVSMGDGETLLISGRMDAFFGGAEPIVEEIKLCQGRQAPEAPYPAHAMQAAVYAHILCEEYGYAGVLIRVAYVDRKGKLRAAFDEYLPREECFRRFDSVLQPYLRRQRILKDHREERNASLSVLPWPFAGWRAGQKEFVNQVSLAVQRRKRLFASMPTGTGKTIATLYPALWSLGRGKTEQVYYLTSRTTQRRAAYDALKRLRQGHMRLWSLTLEAKDKICPCRTLCHPDYCERAKGHFLRDGAALDEMLAQEDWTPEAVRAMADKHCLCPFEFSLALAEMADLVIGDYNYALDPAVHIQRIFDKPGDITLLIDEAHNLLSRLRSMLSGAVDGPRIRKLRTVAGKAAGRSHPVYKAMTALLKELEALPVPEGNEGELESLPESLDWACAGLADALLDAQMEHIPWEESGEGLMDTLAPLMSFLRARKRAPEGYAWLREGKKTPRITAFALDVGSYFAQATQKMAGVVCFSATLEPLEEMKRLLGGEEGDACFSAPSPFPPENLTIRQMDVDTRYRFRTASVAQVAGAIAGMLHRRPGRYMAFFPSFEYMEQVSAALAIPHQKQARQMTEEARRDFLAPYVPGGEPVLSLCVLGGIFAEGIDLPGDALDGVAVVGVGLPQMNLFQQTLEAYYRRTLGDGFLYAYVIPGMQKVAQAVGRVIRSEEDVGEALLMDMRYREGRYRVLLPAHWRVQWGQELTLPAANKDSK